jgi:hypothetical protein
MPAFLAALRQGLPVKHAAGTAGVSVGTTYYYRDRDPRFAAAWQQAAQRGACPQPGPVHSALEPPRNAGWRIAFLEALAETSNVTSAAERAGVPLRRVYKTRRDDPAFAAKWLAALHEGYDHLEIELLGYLRDPAPRRKMDVAGALRLLAAHRETVERRRALEGEEDEQAVLESIDRFIDEMRVRRAANTAIIAETAPDDGTE